MAREVSIAVPRAGRKIFYKARLPKGFSSLRNPRLQRAVETMTQSLKSGPACTIVFFKKKGGTLKAVQRCDDRSLSAQAKRRWPKMRGKSVCRCSKPTCGKRHKGQFQPCRR